MSDDVLKGDWAQIKGKIREQWGKLTQDDMESVGGKKDQLVGKLQERYGHAKDEATRQVDAFFHALKSDDKDPTDHDTQRAR